jgi:hypothetical protein
MDPDDRARVRAAETAALRLVMNSLRMIPTPFWGMDTQFIRHVCCKVPEHLTERQRAHVARVAWRLRRYLPQHLKPRVNPDDPIVKENAERERLHG